MVLSCSICDLILPSDFFNSSVGGLSSGNGIVDLLYSSLSFKLICVNLGIIYSSGGGVGLVFFCLLLIMVDFCLAILELVLVPVSDSGSDSDSDSDSDSSRSDSGSDSGSGSCSDPGLWAGLGPVPGFLFGLLGFGAGFCWFVSSVNCIVIISLCLFSFCLLSLIRRASLTCRLKQVGSLLKTSQPNIESSGSSKGWDCMQWRSIKL